jgi:hypothetical protein
MRNKSTAVSLQTVLTGLPVATASLYLLGVLFYQGFTRTMGVEETLFPLTVDRTLFDGFFALLDLSAAQVGYFVLAAEIIALVAFAIILLSTSIRVRSFVGSWFTRHTHRKAQTTTLEPPPQVTEFANFAVQMFVVAVVVLFVILGILLAGIFADKSGQATANNFLKKVEDGKHAPLDLYLVGQDQPIKAHRVLCSSTHCAFLIGKKTITYRHELVSKTITNNITVNATATR